jgi:hypothetical protein
MLIFGLDIALEDGGDDIVPPPEQPSSICFSFDDSADDCRRPRERSMLLTEIKNSICRGDTNIVLWIGRSYYGGQRLGAVVDGSTSPRDGGRCLLFGFLDWRNNITPYIS